MKKHGAIIIALVLTQLVSAQSSFNSGAFVLSANFGVDGNLTSQHYFNAAENNAQTLNGTVAASNFNIAGEFGLLKWLGLGVIARVDKYYMNNNEVTNTTPGAGAIDLGGTANIHFLRFKHFDLLGGYDLGISQFTYHVNNGVNTMATGNGTWSDIHATGRVYFNRFGVNLSLYTPTINYSSLKSSNTPAGEYVVNYWKSTGYGASIGLQYRF